MIFATARQFFISNHNHACLMRGFAAIALGTIISQSQAQAQTTPAQPNAVASPVNPVDSNLSPVLKFSNTSLDTFSGTKNVNPQPNATPNVTSASQIQAATPLSAPPANTPEAILNGNDTTPVTQNLWERMRKGFAMPTLDTPLASTKTDWYAKQPEYINRMTQRGSQYLFHIVEELEKRGMPTELALLPFVESAFNPQAVSSAKAAGMWQFMPATGKHFNLKQNVWQDDRRGVVESTRAALDYLQKLHGMFGDWHLALAAYNWGEGSVQRAINKNKAKGLSTEYTALKMPLETQQYVPKFQAVKNIIQTPENFGINLAPLANVAFFTSVLKDRDIDVDLAAKFAGLTLPEFKALNPGFKTPVILGESKSEILLPASKLADFNAALQNHTGALSSWTTAQVNSTEKPAALAKRFGMSESELREVNNIPPRMLIKAGSVLVVPKTAGNNAQTSNIPLNLADNAQLNLAPEATRRTHTVRKSETIAGLAKRYGVSVADIRSWNAGMSNEVFTGQKLAVYVAVKQSKVSKKVRTRTAQSAPRKAKKTRA